MATDESDPASEPDVPEHVEEALGEHHLSMLSDRMLIMEYERRHLSIDFPERECESCGEEVDHRVEEDTYREVVITECSECGRKRRVEYATDGGERPNGGQPQPEIDRVMIDIETIGTEPGCVIASIGTVKFGPSGLGETFYESIDIESCQDVGLTIDANTLKWWLGQMDVTRNELKGGEKLHKVLVKFARFVGGVDEVWANSPKFDCGILEAAFEATGTECPWDFYELRDYRTLTALFEDEITVDLEGVEHHALDDAREQALIASKALRKLERC